MHPYFNQDIGDWDVGKVTTMEDMFNTASAFNQDISDWDVSQVENMDDMFNNADLRLIRISAVGMSARSLIWRKCLKGQTAFDQDIGGWDWKVGNVTNMRNMFRRGYPFYRQLRCLTGRLEHVRVAIWRSF